MILVAMLLIAAGLVAGNKNLGFWVWVGPVLAVVGSALFAWFFERRRPR